MNKTSRIYHWVSAGPLDVMVALTMLSMGVGMLIRPDAPFTAYVIESSHLSLALWVDILVTSAFLMLGEYLTKGVTVAHFIILESPLIYVGVLFVGYWFVNPTASVIPVVFALGFLGAINKLNSLRIRLHALGVPL